ncbi:aldehyde dehydrogenase family protein [Marivirga aurantiaca]|uniref:aldehyde dehydrogenase family protein n=1 Tax=Marivirga aurantiaca TaxID=2802615 RepID=UPI00293D2B46|nr:aldehyde dehydrogenase family protein [Marivirga aurantiaca]
MEGAFFEPTILSNVKPGMPAYEEELFGPVAIVIIVKNEEDAINIANDSKFGLGGSVWSQDIEKAKKFVRKVESGAVYINKLMASHPAVPFGGVKKSGYGRELSHLGIKEFVNQKSIWID